MKRKSTVIVEISKILINCLSVALYFIKLYHDVAYLPGIDENGDTVIAHVDYYYSVFDKFTREGFLALLWVSIATIIVSLGISGLNIVIKDNKKLVMASHIIFGISIALFLVAIFVASAIKYCY